MNGILIDTNIYSLAMRGDSGVISILQSAARITICSVSIGELLSGFKGGGKESRNRKELYEFLDSPRVRILGIDENTAEYYAEIITQLKKKGRPIPTNDIWIAAAGFQHGLKLVTADKHFAYISGLLTEFVS